MADEHDLRDTPEPRDTGAEAELPSAERFEQYLDALLTGGRPSPDDVANRDEAEMARLAAELAAAAHPDDAAPNPAFVEQLRLRVRQADQGVENVQVPPPVRVRDASSHPPADGSRGRLRLTRRELFGAAAVAAAGIAAGAAGMTVLRGALEGEPEWWESDLVAGPGRWVPVASESDLPIGAVIRFTTPAFDGFVVNDGGEIRALSASCTHLGCQLQYRAEWPDLRCPCHGASFNLRGWLANGPDKWRQEGPYRGDDEAYPVELAPLARPKVRVADGQVLVFTART